MSKNKIQSKKVTKMNLLLRHYTFGEICEIMGYDDDSNETVATDEMKKLEENNYPEFVNKMMEAAIINGNFESVILHNRRLPI
jgi:hypothetical protein